MSSRGGGVQHETNCYADCLFDNLYLASRSARVRVPEITSEQTPGPMTGMSSCGEFFTKFFVLEVGIAVWLRGDGVQLGVNLAAVAWVGDVCGSASG